jgi:tetratricopeptide (TPR) repeat protein
MDRRLIEALLRQVANSRIDSATDAAQEIMFDAWDERDPERRIAMAHEALKVSPLCADAYVLLAEETAQHPEDAAALYARGVEAGAQALGKEAFESDVGDFWGLIETRPYMRARFGLAVALWSCGRQEEATEHAAELLRLNPDDNQGVRYLLLNWLVALGRHDDASVLMKTYKHDGAGGWAWTTALAIFRRRGRCVASTKALTKAISANQHVADYLLSRKKLPGTLPAYISWGDKDEAVAYAHETKAIWASVNGALAWLEANVPAPRLRKTSRKKSDGGGDQ